MVHIHRERARGVNIDSVFTSTMQHGGEMAQQGSDTVAGYKLASVKIYCRSLRQKIAHIRTRDAPANPRMALIGQGCQVDADIRTYRCEQVPRFRFHDPPTHSTVVSFFSTAFTGSAAGAVPQAFSIALPQALT